MEQNSSQVKWDLHWRPVSGESVPLTITLSDVPAATDEEAIDVARRALSRPGIPGGALQQEARS